MYVKPEGHLSRYCARLRVRQKVVRNAVCNEELVGGALIFRKPPGLATNNLG